MTGASLLVVSLLVGAAAGETAVEAPAKLEGYQLDAPFAVVQKGKTLLELPSGVILPKSTFEAVDQEFVRLQRLEQIHMNEPSAWIWFLSGGVVGTVGAAALLIGFWLVTR